MIFLIILLLLSSTFTHAVHMNSNYFQSESVMPSDCTIQPTQQECMEYAQLTNTPDIAYLEVTSGQPASLGVEVTFGSPDGSMTQAECYAAAAAKGITDASAWDWNGWPVGCVKTGSNQYRWNTVDGGTLCSSTYPCIQKSPTAAEYVNKEECEAYGTSIGKWQRTDIWTNLNTGCFSNHAGDIYYNTYVSNIHCGVMSHNCIQKHSYYNFGHVEVTAGTPALEEDIRHVSEKECKALASYTNAFDGSSHPKGCILYTSTGNIYWNINSNSVGNCGDEDYACIQRDVITHHVAAEGCLSDNGKVRWNIPFLEVSSGSPATLGVSEEECQVYGESIGMWGRTDSFNNVASGCIFTTGNLGQAGQVYYNTHENSNDCGLDLCAHCGNANCLQKPMTELPCAHQCICKRGNVASSTYQAGFLSDRFFEYVEVSTGSPALEGSAAVSQKECKMYAESINKNFGLSGSTYAPAGCIVRYDYDGVQYNTNIGSKIYGVTDFDICGYEWRCIQKVTKTHKFIEVTTGMPATFAVEVSSGKNDGSFSVEECEAYANTISGSNWETYSGTDRPNGCYHSGSSYRFAVNGNLDCGTSTDICIQKSPTALVYVSESECEQYASSNGLTWGGVMDTGVADPQGCYFNGNAIYYNTRADSTKECINPYTCIQKAPFHGKSVQSIVKQAIDAVLHAEMHYAENTNLYIEDFEHPKTTENDILYEKGANFDTTSYAYVYSIAIPDNPDEPEEWRPKELYDSLEEAKTACSADSSNCLGVSHRVNNGIDLYFRHTGTSNDDLGTYTGASYNEYLYFHILKKPFFIRLPSSEQNLELLCNSFPSCFAYGNYVNPYDLEWSQSQSGSANGNHVALFYKEFQLQQATKVNAVYTGKTMFAYAGGYGCPAGNYFLQPEGNYYCQSCGRYLNYGSAWGHGNNYCCTTRTSGCATYFSFISASTITDGLDYNSVDTLYEAVQGCEAIPSCEGITKFKEFSNDVTIEDDDLLSGLIFDGNLNIEAGDDFKLYIYTPRTNSQSHRTDTYTYEHIQDVSGGSLITSSGTAISFFGQNIHSSTSIGYDTSDIDALEICKANGYQFSQLTLHSSFISTLLCTDVLKTVGHDIQTDCFTGHEYKSTIVTVSNGAAATVGSPEYLTYDECSQYMTDAGYDAFYTQTTTSRPPGCWFYEVQNFVYWNYQSDSTTTCNQGPCIQKSSGCFPCGVGTRFQRKLILSTTGTPDLSVTEEQCRKFASENGYAFDLYATTSELAGCWVNTAHTTAYFTTIEVPSGGKPCSDTARACAKPDEGSIANSGCTNCPAGYSSYVFQSECHACASGKTSISGSECENCAAGKYAAVTSGASACTNCEAGTYLETEGNYITFNEISSGEPDLSVSASECRAHHDKRGFNSWINLDSENLATGCLISGTSMRYNVNINTKPCGNEAYNCIQRSQTDGCKACPIGKTHMLTGQTTENSCTSCLPGYFKDGTECVACAAGKTSTGIDGTCNDCPINTYGVGGQCFSCTSIGGYQQETGKASCTACPAGFGGSHKIMQSDAPVLPDLSVSETECEEYATSVGATWGGWKNWNAVAKGCNMYHTSNTVYYITQTSNPNNQCNVLTTYSCIEKQPNYFRKATGTPDGSLNELGCKKYAHRMSFTFNNQNTHHHNVPSGCIVSSNVPAVRWNSGASERECGDHYGDDSTNNRWDCVKISPCGTCASGKYGKAYDLLSYSPVTSGQMSNSVTEKECKQIAVEDTTIRRNELSTRYISLDSGTLPSGCIQTFGLTFTRTPRDNDDVGFINPSDGEMWIYNTQSTSIACSNANICITKVPMDYVEVDYGAPATLGVVMPDGSPAVPGSPEYMSPADCIEYADSIGASYGSPSESGRPKGCWHLTGTGSSNTIYYNTHATGLGSCTTDYLGYPQYCIQKSPTAAEYVNKAECQQYAGNINRPFYDMSYQSHYANGCTRWLAGNDVYWNENSAASANSCGQAGHHCIQKRPATFPVSICHECSLGKFTLPKKHLIPKSTGSPSLSISAEECEAFATKFGMDFTMTDFVYDMGSDYWSDTPQGCTIETCLSQGCFDENPFQKYIYPPLFKGKRVFYNNYNGYYYLWTGNTNQNSQVTLEMCHEVGGFFKAGLQVVNTDDKPAGCVGEWIHYPDSSAVTMYFNTNTASTVACNYHSHLRCIFYKAPHSSCEMRQDSNYLIRHCLEPGGPALEKEDCTTCPSGTYHTSAYASNKDDCLSCPAGQYQDGFVHYQTNRHGSSYRWFYDIDNHIDGTKIIPWHRLVSKEECYLLVGRFTEYSKYNNFASKEDMGYNMKLQEMSDSAYPVGCMCYTGYSGVSLSSYYNADPYECYYNMPVTTIVKISSGAPDLSVSQAECEAYHHEQDDIMKQNRGSTEGLTDNFDSLNLINGFIPQGCFESISTYDGSRKIRYNAATDDALTGDCGTHQPHEWGVIIYSCLEKRATPFQTSEMGVAVDKIFRHQNYERSRWIQFTYDALLNENAVPQNDRYAYTINDCKTCGVGTYKEVPGLNKYMSQQEGWPMHPMSEEECREYAQLIGIDTSNFVVKNEAFHITYNNEPDSVFDFGCHALASDGVTTDLVWFFNTQIIRKQAPDCEKYSRYNKLVGQASRSKCIIRNPATLWWKDLQFGVPTQLSILSEQQCNLFAVQTNRNFWSISSSNWRYDYQQNLPSGCMWLQRSAGESRNVWYNPIKNNIPCSVAGNGFDDNSEVTYNSRTGPPNLSMSKDECETYMNANLWNSNYAFSVISAGDSMEGSMPKGCVYHYESNVNVWRSFYNEGESTLQCGESVTSTANYNICIQKYSQDENFHNFNIHEHLNYFRGNSPVCIVKNEIGNAFYSETQNFKPSGVPFDLQKLHPLNKAYHDHCHLCPSGRTHSQTGVSNSHACTLCEAGQYVTTTKYSIRSASNVPSSEEGYLTESECREWWQHESGYADKPFSYIYESHGDIYPHGCVYIADLDKVFYNYFGTPGTCEANWNSNPYHRSFICPTKLPTSSGTCTACPAAKYRQEGANLYKVLKGHQTPRGMIHNTFNQFQFDECFKLFARHNWGNINYGPAHFNFNAAKVTAMQTGYAFNEYWGSYDYMPGGCLVLVDSRNGYDFYYDTTNRPSVYYNGYSHTYNMVSDGRNLYNAGNEISVSKYRGWDGRVVSNECITCSANSVHSHTGAKHAFGGNCLNCERQKYWEESGSGNTFSSGVSRHWDWDGVASYAKPGDTSCTLCPKNTVMNSQTRHQYFKSSGLPDRLGRALTINECQNMANAKYSYMVLRYLDDPTRPSGCLFVGEPCPTDGRFQAILNNKYGNMENSNEYSNEYSSFQWNYNENDVQCSTSAMCVTSGVDDDPRITAMGYNGNNNQCNKCPAGRNTARSSSKVINICDGCDSVTDFDNGVCNCGWGQSDIDDCIWESGKPTSTTDWSEFYSQKCSSTRI